MEPSRTHLLLIPSYNTGPRLRQTVAEARAVWRPVWVVVDGSTDGSAEGLVADRVLRLPRNAGKGAAVRAGLVAAEQARYTHVLTMDADGQHPADHIPPFMAESVQQPGAMVLGQPQFGPDAPRARVWGRRLSNICADLETSWAGVGDSLFGFRVYPVAPLLAAMDETSWMRGYDFDAEAAVRLCWRGVRPISLPVPVRYLRRDQGGVSHFRYGRDNLLLTWMHLRLLLARLRR